MRILLVSQEYPPETSWGGIGTYVGTLAPALARLGAEVHVLSVVPGQEHSDRTDQAVAVHRRPLRRLPGVGRVTRLPETWGRLSLLSRAVSREAVRLGIRFDVCESPEWMAEGLALSRRIPTVVRLHLGARHVFDQLGRTGLDARWAIAVEDTLTRRARRVIGTPAQYEVALQCGVTEGHWCPINLPVELPRVWGDEIDPFRVLFVGRFERRKNPEAAIRAFAHLRARMPHVRLRLVGRDTSNENGGSVVADLRQLIADLGVGDGVELIDAWMTPDQVRQEMRVAAAVIVPSRWESFGLVAAEAAALGRPVVASAIPGLAEVVRDRVTGRLVDTEDPRAWADAIGETMADNAVRESLGRAGREHVAMSFDPARIARLTLEAYGVALNE